MKRNRSSVFLFVFLVSAVGLAKPCGSFKKLEFTSAIADFYPREGEVRKNQTVSRGVVGDYAWDVLVDWAMIRNRMNGKTCPALFQLGDESEITYSLVPGNRVLVHLSGADTQSVSYFDLETCTKLWDAKSSNIVVEGRRVKLAAKCGACDVAQNYATVCTCENAEVYVVNKSCDLELSRPESKSYTKKELGVGFMGKHDVKNAKSPKAKLLN